MEQIINKYKDENGFIIDFIKLYKELINYGLSQNQILETLTKFYLNNNSIKSKMNEVYKKEQRIIENRKLNKNFLDYEVSKKTPNEAKENNTQSSKKTTIDFYIKFIEENLENDVFLEILPKQLNTDSLIIFANILNYYKKQINFIKCILAIEKEEQEIDLLLKDMFLQNLIYEKVLAYKDNLKNIQKEDKFENNTIFFMNGEEPYFYYDILDCPTSYPSFKKLLDSIQNGTFKNISKFSDYNGLLEVRDISNQTRIIFERRNNAYCIIGGITNKAETNKLYREKLSNRFKTYQNNKDNIDNLDNTFLLKKIITGDKNE